MQNDLCTVISLNEVRLAALREEEQAARARGEAVQDTPGQFICLGFEIEALQ